MSRIAIALTAAALLASAPADAAETIKTVDWAEQKRAGPITAGEVLPPGDGASTHRLLVRGARSKVWSLDNPGIHTQRYALLGQVRCRGVAGQGHLELWNVFGGERYFTRTLSAAGPMQSLSGDQGWRPFVLPFVAGGDERPTRLELNVVLPGRGEVELGALRLVALAADEDPLALAATDATSGAWWSGRAAGIIGGSLGSLLGLLGGLVGVLGGMGRARGFVLGLLKVLIVFGLAASGVGLFAWLSGQPHAVYYPLLLCGMLDVLIPAALHVPLKRRYEQLELRRMRALDA